MKCLKYFVVFLLLGGNTRIVYAQDIPYKLKTIVRSALESQPLMVYVEPLTPFEISSATLFYRSIYGTNNAYVPVVGTVTGKELSGKQFVFTIPSEHVLLPGIEYYIIAKVDEAVEVTYPELEPRESPAYIAIEQWSQSSSDITVVSPGENVFVNINDAAVIFSYYQLSEKIDPTKCHFFFNGTDVTQSAIISENIASYVPPFYAGNVSSLIILNDSSGKEVSKRLITFTIVESKGQIDATKYKYYLDTWAQARYEQTADTSLFLGSGSLSGSFEWANILKLTLYTYIASDEDYTSRPIRQSINRYYASIEVPYFKAEVGDIYNNYNFYLNSGQRVRGVQGIFHYNALRIAGIFGETNRETYPTLAGGSQTINKSDPDATRLANELINLGYIISDTTIATVTFRKKLSYGTNSYRRQYIGALVGINDPGFILEAQVVRQSDEFDPHVYNIKGINPQQSLGISLTFRGSIIKEILSIYCDAAYTLSNTNISSGSFRSAEDLGEYLGGSKSQVLNFINGLPGGYTLLTSLLTINTSLSPSNIFDLSALAIRGGLQFTLFNNTFQFEFSHQGNSFEAFSPYYLKDIQSFKIFDRVRLIDNKLFITASFEYSTDNLSGKKNIKLRQDNQTLSATTTRMNIKGGIFLNLGGLIPSVRLDFTRQTNVNAIPDTYTDVINGSQITMNGLKSQIKNTLYFFSANLQENIPILENNLNFSASGTIQIGSDDRNFSNVANYDLSGISQGSSLININGVSYSISDILTIPTSLSAHSITVTGTFSTNTGVDLGLGFSNQSSEFFVSKDTKNTTSYNSIEANGGIKLLSSTLAISLRSLDKDVFLKALVGIRGSKTITEPTSEEHYNSLERYAKDLNLMAKQNKLDPVIGRDDEIRRVLQILSRRTKNNPVLIGDPGVGKTAIVEGLAHKIISGVAPDNLATKRVFALDISSLVAGTKFRGEFEERMKSVIKEVTSSNGEIVLFIDEIHLLVGAGNASEGAMDAANILKPALARGEIHVIGATTLSEYKKYIEKDAALERRFQPIIVNEPNVEDTISILRGLKEKYEIHHGVRISDSALIAAAELSDRYIGDRFLPDKAIDVIDEVGSKFRLDIDSVPEEIDKLNREIRKLEIERAALLKELNSED
ncbi:hypothetical protein CHS0354_000658 [Potamilus streckersoni]|uniref:AAA+ ATPase domain-containing protein n=1 Tax=Potamilus streckersoni TaxID=2493646 RepID=A0AAE0W7I5_9BIVA|nr:hypothetical protein CHS0354_000658 [Potamilus streckersoni]